jgi:hypothetical protein
MVTDSDHLLLQADHSIALDKLDPTLDFLAGTAAGISGLVVGFPFDTGECNRAQLVAPGPVLVESHKVKYRFQNPSPNARYRSTFHALVTIAREERLHGLFKGISSPLVRRAVRHRRLLPLLLLQAERIEVPYALPDLMGPQHPPLPMNRLLPRS